MDVFKINKIKDYREKQLSQRHQLHRTCICNFVHTYISIASASASGFRSEHLLIYARRVWNNSSSRTAAICSQPVIFFVRLRSASETALIRIQIEPRRRAQRVPFATLGNTARAQRPHQYPGTGSGCGAWRKRRLLRRCQVNSAYCL